jgi:hypothetical protein
MCLQMILGDAVVVSGCFILVWFPYSCSKIWRLYVVYDKQLLVVIPAILLVTIYTGT